MTNSLQEAVDKVKLLLNGYADTQSIDSLQVILDTCQRVLDGDFVPIKPSNLGNNEIA